MLFRRCRHLSPAIIAERPMAVFALLVAAVPLSPMLLMTAASLAAPTIAHAAPATAEDEEDTPTQAPLTVGSMAIASDSALVIEGMAVDVGTDRIAYAYRLRNKGTAKLALTASVALPDLEVNNEGTTIYALPSSTAENPVDLKVKSDDKPLATTPLIQAIALGLDRLAVLKEENLPLLPFGEAIDKALAAAKPDTLSKLEQLGLVTPRDPAQPDTPVIADWSLHNVLTWTQPIEAGAATNVVVSFAPIKATYTVDAPGLGGFDVLKEQACLTPQIMAAAKGLVKAQAPTATKTAAGAAPSPPPAATIEVVDITLANDGPARWLDNPAATVAVRRPKPNSVVAFCGMDAATANQPVVKGTMPGSSEAGGLRVLVFSASGT